LTERGRFLISSGGTPLPTEGQLSGRIDYGQYNARHAAGRAAFFVRPLRQAPRLEPPSPHRRRSRTLAPVKDRQGEAQARHRSDPRGARSPCRLSHRHRAGIRHRGGGDGALVAARRAARHHDGVGIVRRRLGHRRRQTAQAQGRDRAEGRLRRTAGSLQSRFFDRRGVHLERHHLRRARAERGLDSGRSAGPHDLRRASRSATPPPPVSRRPSISPSSMS
jgi:hypothetical protein